MGRGEQTETADGYRRQVKRTRNADKGDYLRLFVRWESDWRW
jgi:hypothetical protein